MDRTSGSNADTTLAPSRATSISFCPASHPATPFRQGGFKARHNESLPRSLLHAVAPSESEICHELLHTSLPSNANDIRPQTNGFVDTVIEAYNRHRGLVIRPDDVWLSILTQFTFFVNGNAETLRIFFVAHEGKQELEVKIVGSRYTLDPAWMAHRMTELMEGHLVDEALRDWVSPSFTTTTVVDKATCAMVMMGMMKEYFSYKISAMCGIPNVTLEGEKKDWEDILRRLERLKKYGLHTTAWFHLLRPVISRFVAAYDNPTSPANLDFWNKVVQEESLGSGSPLLSGWITAFCVFDEEGRWQGNWFDEQHLGKPQTMDYLQMNASEFASAYLLPLTNSPYLELDDSRYPTINTGQIPCGYTRINVTFDDNGELLDTMLVAGSIGSRICFGSGEKEKGLPDTVRPVSAWWYFVKAEKPPTATSNPHHSPTQLDESKQEHRSFFDAMKSKGTSLLSSVRRKQ